jgi:hypothetical protein
MFGSVIGPLELWHGYQRGLKRRDGAPRRPDPQLIDDPRRGANAREHHKVELEIAPAAHIPAAPRQRPTCGNPAPRRTSAPVRPPPSASHPQLSATAAATAQTHAPPLPAPRINGETDRAGSGVMDGYKIATLRRLICQKVLQLPLGRFLRKGEAVREEHPSWRYIELATGRDAMVTAADDLAALLLR